jgi:hypothetical protein
VRHYTSNYLSISFDIKVDPISGMLADGTYGHFQAVLRNSSGSWGGIGWPVLDSTFTNGWQHVEFGFNPPYDDIASLVIQVQGTGYSGDVVYYLDNIKINPIPPVFIYQQFTNAASVQGFNAATGWAQPGTNEWSSTENAGGGAAPGALKLINNFSNVPSGYQQVVFQKEFAFDPSRYTYLDLDLKLDSASYTRANGTDCGYFEMILACNGWQWKGLGAQRMYVTNNNWIHMSLPIAGQGITNMQAFLFKLGENSLTNTVILYVDNIKFWYPETPPTVSIAKASGIGGGLEIVSTNPTYEWTRQNIVTPADYNSWSWMDIANPVIYSFTITNFPSPASNPGFRAHMYMVNYNTLPGDKNWESTYPGIDWNASNIVAVALANNAGGGVDFAFAFRTNFAYANITNVLATIHDTSALGTWTVTFENNTSVTLTTASGATTNFTFPAEAAAYFAGDMLLHFGTFKNGFVNNGAVATFSRIKVEGTGSPYPIDETFPGPTLNPDPNAAILWRTAADLSGLNIIPPGTAWWLYWTLPDTGFSPQISGSVTGTWSDPGITFINEVSTGKKGAVPASSIPAGNSAFLRLIK